MFKYIDKMIYMCPGCIQSDTSNRKVHELIYSFPVDEPMKVVHTDVYTVCAELEFSGHRNFMVIVCGMCTFAVWEPLKQMNSTTFADAIMKILLQFG